MEISKSTRHQKIIGDFGENLLCNWLSRSGFEVAIIDHTGIDLIASHPKLEKPLGISVKSRTRSKETENVSVNIFYEREGKGKKDREKVEDACRAFRCEPWIAIYSESTDCGDLYITSLSNYDEKYGGNSGRKVDDWKMDQKHQEEYNKDDQVLQIHMDFSKMKWDWEKIAENQTRNQL